MGTAALPSMQPLPSPPPTPSPGVGLAFGHAFLMAGVEFPSPGRLRAPDPFLPCALAQEGGGLPASQRALLLQ